RLSPSPSCSTSLALGPRPRHEGSGDDPRPRTPKKICRPSALLRKRDPKGPKARGIVESKATSSAICSQEGAEASAGQSRQKDVGEQVEMTPSNRASPTPGGVHPRETQPCAGRGDTPGE